MSTAPRRRPMGFDNALGSYNCFVNVCVQLLWHLSQGPGSLLRPYLDLLPGRAPGTPTPCVGMLMTEGAVEELQYGPLQEDVMNQKWVHDVHGRAGVRDVHGRGSVWSVCRADLLACMCVHGPCPAATDRSCA